MTWPQAPAPAPSRPRHLKALRLGQSVVHSNDAFVPATTSLFRSPDQLLACARAGALAAARRHEAPRALCVGVSSGEEAYSLLAAFDAVGATDATVLGIDCEPDRIAKAGEAVFAGSEPWPTWVPAGAFERDALGRLRPGAALRDRATFAVGDVLQLTPPRTGRAHVVLCRNVLTYFTPEARAVATRALAASVCPEGSVFLGAAERLLPEGQGLTLVSRGAYIAYRDSNFG